MELLPIFRKTSKGLYRCVCGDLFQCVEDTQYHIDEGGYCDNGIRVYDNNKYECKCGMKNMNRVTAEFTHWYENKGKCIQKSITKSLTYCDICNKHFHNISWYERHCMTEKHKKLSEGYTILPLECKICNVVCSSQAQIIKHLATQKHKEIELTHETPISLECKICNIKCRGQKEIKSHLQTKKHKKNESKSTTT